MPPLSWYDCLTLALIALILVGVAVGRYPVLRMNRATIALAGAAGLVWIGAIPLERAHRAIDLDTITLLFAMMVINANLQLAGFFNLVAAGVAGRARSPRQLLALTVASAGGLSALFLNDTVVLVFTPLVLQVTRALGLNPIPFLIALATAANVGSCATPIGNPQNMLIAIASGIPFTTFVERLLPVAAGGLLLVWGVVGWLWRGDLAPRPLIAPTVPVRLFRPLLRKGVVAVVLVVVALLAGAPPALAALGGAALLLVTRRIKPERVFREIDWSLLVFFAGLFVVTAALEGGAVGARFPGWAALLADQGVGALTGVTALLSNLISNVPAVLLLRPFVGHLADPEGAWLVLAMASTLAGNLTLLGSVANLIVAESARVRGVTVGFGVYLRAGLPITLLSLGWGVWWLG